MAGWHHRLNGHEFESTPGVGDGQGGLACYSSWGGKESDTTEWLTWNELNWWLHGCLQASCLLVFHLWCSCLMAPFRMDVSGKNTWVRTRIIACFLCKTMTRLVSVREEMEEEPKWRAVLRGRIYFVFPVQKELN